MALGLGMVQRLQNISWPKRAFSFVSLNSVVYDPALAMTLLVDLHYTIQIQVFIGSTQVYLIDDTGIIFKTPHLEGEQAYFDFYPVEDLAAKLKEVYGDDPVPDEVNIRSTLVVSGSGWLRSENIVRVLPGKNNSGGGNPWSEVTSEFPAAASYDKTVKLNTKTFKFVT